MPGFLSMHLTPSVSTCMYKWLWSWWSIIVGILEEIILSSYSISRGGFFVVALRLGILFVLFLQKLLHEISASILVLCLRASGHGSSGLWLWVKITTANKQDFKPSKAQFELMVFLATNSTVKTNSLQPEVELCLFAREISESLQMLVPAMLFSLTLLFSVLPGISDT